jgi:hypothetical protein
MDGAERSPFHALTDDEQRRIARCFYGLRNTINRDPASEDTELAYLLLSGAYLACTGEVLEKMPEPSKRRLWVDSMFVELLRYVAVQVWNTTHPKD